ncbi:RluA family pseudouridine synthase [Leptolyngbya sp. FACHB-261]|uniref:RluA family pseudouridine synthase n=1 Tax=Leptolyngbya sp. FACHB-261 TaxID=2692806 RepID=UPI0016843C83|nr:RluA family pseudouridine synthase [Leptolyngbya sp. FACHB-261]MBD2103677.1 RluA family pseudouridine synthase [Leptolyngbya sp. FACHB-261]
MNSGWVYRDQIRSSAEGLTVLDYYTRHYRHSNQVEWQSRILAGQILLDGASTQPETCLRAGQQLTYHRPPWQEPDVPLTFETVYEDSELLVIAKPSGLPVLPGGGFLEHTLLRQLQQRYPNQPPMPIHRLGRGTSGLLLLARSSQARAALSQQMRTHQIVKTYRTLAVGNSMPECFRVTQPIGKLAHPVLGYLYAATPDGLSAQSDCRVLQRGTETSLLEVVIATGRPHQIRIHLAVAGYPLLGDPLYGSGGLPLSVRPDEMGEVPVPGDCGYHLHALKLEFHHPLTGERLRLSCPPPLDLA